MKNELIFLPKSIEQWLKRELKEYKSKLKIHISDDPDYIFSSIERLLPYWCFVSCDHTELLDEKSYKEGFKRENFENHILWKQYCLKALVDNGFCYKVVMDFNTYSNCFNQMTQWYKKGDKDYYDMCLKVKDAILKDLPINKQNKKISAFYFLTPEGLNYFKNKRKAKTREIIFVKLIPIIAMLAAVAAIIVPFIIECSKTKN